MERDVGLTVLLTQRAAALKNHAGQVAFPGGRVGRPDPPGSTALRETRKKSDAGADVTVLGFLDAMAYRERGFSQ